MAEITKPNDINKIWADTGTAIKPDDSKIALGWVVEPPPHQTENWLNKKHDQALAHVNQMGFFEWDNITEYRANKSWTLGSNGNIYFCKVTNTGQNPVTDTSETYWRRVMDGNTVISYPQVSTYVRDTFFPSTNATQARTNLGFTNLGGNLVTSSTASAARSFLGSRTVGDLVFLANSQVEAKSAIGIVDADESNKGLVQRASDPEVIAGVEDTKFVTSRKLKLGFSISLSGNGFINFPSWLGGLIVRWGSVTLGSDSSSFVTTFPTAVLNIQATIAANSNDASQAMNVSTSGTSVRITNPESSSRSIYWLAIGY